MTIEQVAKVTKPALKAMNGNGREHEDLRPEDFLTQTARSASEDGIRSMWKYDVPGTVSFLCVSASLLPRTITCANCDSAGKPHPGSFPFGSITLNLKPPLGTTSTDSEPVSLQLEGEDLADSLQYGPSAGLPKLRAQLLELQTEVHEREDDGSWGVITGAGCQNLIGTAFGCLLDPGDPILIETPAYAGVFPSLRALGAEMIEVGVDDGGLSPQELDRVMSEWPQGKKRPNVLYLNPIGCNPSGCSHSVQRRMDVLILCRKHGLLIVEDDPYYYLAESRIPSYFELETQVFPGGGRVLRFDSFSKLLSAGMRLGFASGPKVILDAIVTVNSGSILQASSLSQGVASRLISHWGIEGFLNHGQHVADLYAARRNRIEAIARKHLSGLAEWVSPVAGMFLWIDLSPSGIKDSRDFALKAADSGGVLTVPGSAFFPNKRVSSYVRLSFSIVDLDEAAELGIVRLAEAIKTEQKQLRLI